MIAFVSESTIQITGSLEHLPLTNVEFMNKSYIYSAQTTGPSQRCVLVVQQSMLIMDAYNLCAKIWKLSLPARTLFVEESGDNFKANSPWIRWFSLIVGDKALFTTAGYVFRCYSLPKSIVECLLPVQKSRVRTKYQGFGKTNRCMCDFNLKCCKKVTVRLGFEYLIIPYRHQCILRSCRVS